MPEAQVIADDANEIDLVKSTLRCYGAPKHTAVRKHHRATMWMTIFQQIGHGS
jgi:hypothetical protein